MTVDREHVRATAEAYVRLARIAAELVERTEVDGEVATIPTYLVRRLERECGENHSRRNFRG